MLYNERENLVRSPVGERYTIFTQLMSWLPPRCVLPVTIMCNNMGPEKKMHFFQSCDVRNSLMDFVFLVLIHACVLKPGACGPCSRWHIRLELWGLRDGHVSVQGTKHIPSGGQRCPGHGMGRLRHALHGALHGNSGNQPRWV